MSISTTNSLAVVTDEHIEQAATSSRSAPPASPQPAAAAAAGPPSEISAQRCSAASRDALRTYARATFPKSPRSIRMPTILSYRLCDSTRLDCIDRPQATHRYDRRGGHEPTHPQPKQADAFTHTRKTA